MMMGLEIKSFRPFALVLAAMTMVAMSATAALAQYPPSEDFGVSCTDTSPGATAECSVVGAGAGEVLSVSASADGDTFYEDSTTADADGSATFGFTVPTEVLGEVIVRVSGPESGDASTTVTVSADVDQVADEDESLATDPGERLPITGGQIGLLLVLAMGLIAVGAAATRKKNRETVNA